MRHKRIMTIMIVSILLAWSATNASADALILSVPDIDQPDNYAAGTPGLNVGDYPGWCCPTSGAMVMGYWEDVKGCVGLTDRQAFPASPAYPNPATPGTWQQGLWHDGTVEMGWHMDTGGWQSVPRGFPPLAGSTAMNKIGPGMLNYANAAYNDVGTGIVKVAYPNTAIGKDTVRNAAMWANYTAEIDAGRPLIVSWQHWVAGPTGQTWVVNGQTVTEYAWNTNVSEHCVCGVGYIDLTPGFQDDGTDEWIIAQDNWPTTVQYVAVPVGGIGGAGGGYWMQNDYVTNVPEPFTMTLLVLGSAGLIRRRKR